MPYVQCVICDRIVWHGKLTAHIKQTHSLSARDYYHKHILKSEVVPKCIECGKELEFVVLSNPYHETCSMKCKYKRRETAWVGENNPFFGRKHSEEARNKMSDSAIARGPHPGFSEYLKPIWSVETRAKHGEFMRERWKDRNYRNSVYSRGKQGYYESTKAGIVMYKSSWELNTYKLLDSDYFVESYIYEPFPIPYSLDEKPRNYYPDLLIIYADGYKEVVEIKPCCFLKYLDVRIKIYAAIDFCLSNGYGFDLWTEESQPAIATEI